MKDQGLDFCCFDPIGGVLSHLCAPWNNTSYSSKYGLHYVACLQELLAFGWPSDTVLGPAQTDADWLFTHPVMDT
jgi:hypothetical protein